MNCTAGTAAAAAALAGISRQSIDLLAAGLTFSVTTINHKRLLLLLLLLQTEQHDRLMKYLQQF